MKYTPGMSFMDSKGEYRSLENALSKYSEPSYRFKRCIRHIQIAISYYCYQRAVKPLGRQIPS